MATLQSLSKHRCNRDEYCEQCGYPFDAGDIAVCLSNGEVFCSPICAEDRHDGAISRAVHAEDGRFAIASVTGADRDTVVGSLVDAVCEAKRRCTTDSTCYEVYSEGLLMGRVTMRGFSRHIPRYTRS